MMIGYKYFIVDEENKLTPTYAVWRAKDWYHSGWAEAKCGFGSSSDHGEVPDLAYNHLLNLHNCNCGFYSFKESKSPISLRNFSLKYVNEQWFSRFGTRVYERLVWTQVELAGIVVEGEVGFRSSKARVIEIFNPEKLEIDITDLCMKRS